MQSSRRDQPLPIRGDKPLSFGGLLRIAPLSLGGAVVTAVASAALSIAPFWFIYRITEWVGVLQVKGW